jgi:hypothetical protein
MGYLKLHTDQPQLTIIALDDNPVMSIQSKGSGFDLLSSTHHFQRALHKVARCYTGLLVRKDALWLDPKLPEELKRLKFSLSYREHTLNFNVTPRSLKLSSTRKRGSPIRIRLPGRSFELKAGDDCENSSCPEHSTATATKKTFKRSKGNQKKFAA